MTKKKTWIKIKRGLLDPKHRSQMGNKIWVYFHILDRANWDDGIVYDWRDQDEAEDISMNWRTLQKHRQGLEDEGYISCVLRGSHQEIIIHNWTNPREYSGKKYNESPESTQKDVLLESEEKTEGTPKSTLKGVSKRSTSTYDSQITNHINNKDMSTQPKTLCPEFLEIKETLTSEYGATTFETYIEPISSAKIEDGVLIMGVPNAGIRQFLDEQIGKFMRASDKVSEFRFLVN